MSRFLRKTLPRITRKLGFEVVPYDPTFPSGQKINRLVIDSSDCMSDLCKLGVQHPTDKSPYNATLHRHPYTPVYDFLFAVKRYEPITFGEIGIEKNQSMICWRSYFPKAQLYGWDFDQVKIDNGRNASLANTIYGFMDVKDAQSIRDGLNSAGRPFDVLIDDSTHEFDDQVRVVKLGLQYLKAGGIMVVEDVFQGREGFEEDRYYQELSGVWGYFSSSVFVECRHKNRYSPGWNNDKLLVLFRNDQSMITG